MDEGLGTRAAYHRYTHVAIVLHWVIAAAIVYNLVSGLLGEYLPGWFFVFHISSGLTVLILSVARVVWRLTHKPPPFLPMQGWEAKLAHGVHFLLYAAMLLLPFSGWALISANPPAGSPGAAQAQAQRAAEATAKGQPAPKPRGPTMFWGVVPVPKIGPITEMGRTPEGLPEQRELHERIETIHAIGGWIMLALLVLHLAGALKHHFVDREPELGRMGVGRRPGERARV